MKPGEKRPLRDVRVPIVAVAIVLTLIPTLAAFYSVQGILHSAVAIGLNPEVDRELEGAGRRLKELARLAPVHEAEYRAEFERLQSVRRDYNLLLETRPAVDRSLFEVFSIIFGFSLALAIGLAWLLNRKIVGAYDLAIAKMSAAEHRTAYLETRESWSVVAQKMVHEVKNPLTPVQVMVGRLRKKYLEIGGDSGTSQSFLAAIEETDQMVQEEVGKVNSWVEAFARYARTPEPELVTIELRAFVDEVVRQFSEYWETHLFRWADRPNTEFLARVDPRLFRQVVFNLCKNSVESVGGFQGVVVEFALRVDSSDTFTLSVTDDGPGIPTERSSRLFLPFQTNKAEGKGMGLGLAICKRIMVDLGGDIRLAPLPSAQPGTSFALSLPMRIHGETS